MYASVPCCSLRALHRFDLIAREHLVPQNLALHARRGVAVRAEPGFGRTGFRERVAAASTLAMSTSEHPRALLVGAVEAVIERDADLVREALEPRVLLGLERHDGRAVLLPHLLADERSQVARLEHLLAAGHVHRAAQSRREDLVRDVAERRARTRSSTSCRAGGRTRRPCTGTPGPRRRSTRRTSSRARAASAAMPSANRALLAVLRLVGRRAIEAQLAVPARREDRVDAISLAVVAQQRLLRREHACVRLLPVPADALDLSTEPG